MSGNNKDSTNMEPKKIEKTRQQSNSDPGSNGKLIDELIAYGKVLRQERKRLKDGGDKNRMIPKLSQHLQSVELLIDEIGTKGLKGVLDRAKANETALTEGIHKLKEQVTAKSNNPDSFKSLIDEIPNKVNNLFKK
jgi:hypothetical protein